MNESITAEFFILRKRASTRILLAIWGTLAIFFGYLVPYITYRNNAGALGQSPLEELLPQNFVGNTIGAFPFYGGAIILMLGVLSFGSEYGWGTLKTLFTQRPGRLQVFTAKMLALGLMLVPFVLVVFAIGAVSSGIIAQQEDVALVWPSAWSIIRAILAGWFILAVWAALGVMLAVLWRGTSLAIGIGILYALVIEGLVSTFASQVSFLEPIVEFLLRANAYSLITGFDAAIDNSGPGRFAGPFVSAGQAFFVLAVYLTGFLLLPAFLLRWRDVDA